MTSEKSPLSNISVTSLGLGGSVGSLLKKYAPLVDRALGMKKLNQLYLRDDLSGLPKETFVRNALLTLGIHYTGTKKMKNTMPSTGPVILVCNHPYGGAEGMIMADVLGGIRPDVKIMANMGLKVFRELEDFFIFTNPLVSSNPKNMSSIRSCIEHLGQGGVLVLFPASRVSFYRKEKRRITDGEWNRIAAQLAIKMDVPVIPIFFSGQNSPVFQLMGRIYSRFRLLMLTRELLKLNGKVVDMNVGKILPPTMLGKFEDNTRLTAFLRLQTYLLDPAYRVHPDDLGNERSKNFQSLILPSDNDRIKHEVNALPEDQHLFQFRGFSVYCGYRPQLEQTVREITRLRELTFRLLDEGSGEGCDTDDYDDTYLHLFATEDSSGEVIAAYRIGQTDVLLQQAKISELYLSHMFDFGENFLSKWAPSLEMGRSFVVPKHQNKFYGLYLLWRGIGNYVVKNPRYRTLYGTVSLSRQYSPQSIALISHILVREDENVRPYIPLGIELNAELDDYIAKWQPGFDELSVLVQAIEADGKDLPILLKQYRKLGARFHGIGLDDSFSNTPGLLLSIHLPDSPVKQLRTYLGKGIDSYLNF